MSHSPIAISLFALALGACDTQAYEPGAPCDSTGSSRFLPMTEGASWTYDTTDADSGVIVHRTQQLGAARPMEGAKDGIVAAPLVTEKDSGNIINWHQDLELAIINHRQEDSAGKKIRDDVYEPYKIRLDETPERLVEGARYSHTYTATDLRSGIAEHRVEDWEVVSAGQLVEVPAGMFCAIQVSRQRTTDGDLGQVKRYWFARGAGKVIERSERSVEVLTDYRIP
jgi:hypothetical protein